MRRIAGLLLAAGLFGCRSATEPDTLFVGSYSLTSVDGGPIYSEKVDRVTYTYGVIWLDADQTSSAYMISQDCFLNGCTSPDVKFGFTGTWTRKDNEFTLADSSTGQVMVCRYSAGNLTVTDTKDFSTPTVLVFKKDSVTTARS